MYNIFEFLLVPVRNKVYKDAARVHFIFDVVCAIHFITVAKSEMYCMGVKSMAS